MGIFSDDKKKIPIHHPRTESSDPVVSDIIDLRKMRQKTGAAEPAPAARAKSAPEPKHSKAASDKKFDEAAKNFFKKEGPKVVSYYSEKPKRSLPSFSRRAWYSLAGVGTVGVAALVLSTVFARATVIVQPKREDFTLSKIAVTVDPAVSLPDTSSRRIPGEQIQYTEDVTMTFPTTGEKYVETRAKGTIIISNKFSSSSQSLVQATRFQETKTGYIYRLTKAVTVPGAKIENGNVVASSIEAEVQADQVGDTYNISSGSFTIPGFKDTPKYNGFTAVLKNPASGGFKGTSRVISKDDLAKAADAFQKESYARLQTKSLQNTPAGFTLVPAAEKFDIPSQNVPAVGQPGESFALSGKARLTNVGFQEKTLLEFFNRIVNGEASEQKKVVQSKSKLTYDTASIAKDGRMSLSVSGTLATEAALNPSAIAAAAIGKSLEDAKSSLRDIQEIGPFGIKVFPFWRSTIPRDSSKIVVEVATES